MIILTKTQANQVRMLTSVGHALAPRLISVAATASLAGKLALGEECINDPFHAEHKALLQSFPTVPDASVLISFWETNPTLTVPNTYNSTWQAGQLVIVT